jgi:nucleotide-binding universal stress UspA family protein
MVYSHILVPTDFSPAARRALEYAVEEATLHQARLTLLHVLQHQPTTAVYYVKDAPQSGTGYAEFGEKLPAFPASPPQTVRQDYEAEALVQLHDLKPAAYTGVWEVQVTVGDPAEEIVAMADALDVDLIAMSTHGRTGLSHLLLGSVAEKVVRHAHCPVLTVRQRERTA